MRERAVKIHRCPTCGSRRIRSVRRNWIGKIEGKSYSVPSLQFYECPDCGERIYGAEAIRKIEAHSPVFTKAVPRKKSA